MRLQGYGVDGNGNVSQTRLGDIQVGDASAPPNATSEAQMRLNLGAGTEISGPFDPADPSGSSNFASSTTVYDSLGNAIDADAYYVKTAENTWEVHVMIDGGDSAGGTAGTPLEIGTSTLDFDTDGALTAGSPLTLSMTPAGATSPQTIELDLTGTTQFAGESAVSFASQDGYGAGELRGLEISDDGTMMGVFSNGEQIALGQVALAKVSAPEFLDRLGGNLWRVTQQSGEALAGAPSSGGRGAMVSGAVEGSNVDITYEFVKMIATQRGFQANSRSITTADQMITEAIQLKR
jgi:flagellar hook protein FlgE